MNADGSVNSTILDNVMRYLLEYRNGIVIIKSTITPNLVKKYPSSVVYNPEFLTEKAAKEDFVNCQFHVLGGSPVDTALVKELYETCSLCNPCPVFEMSIEEASFVKYTINSFLALKVTFFNQLYDAAKDADVNFAAIIKAVGSDNRIGHSHTKVPGFDGKQGFGGACFPKDTSAFTKYSNRLTLLEHCITINNQYRSQYELDEREKAQNVTYEQTKKEQ
jgi:nucleotide sugar dehydrogenase